MNLHRIIQERIVSLLPQGEALLEKKMGVHRADVFWEKEGIVFEIQCSPLPLEAALLRTKAYHDRALHLVWILHTKSFNQRLLTASELFLRSQTSYYTRMSKNAVIGFYDQLDLIKGNKRIYRTAPLLIDLAKPHKNPKLGFKGDRSTQNSEILEAFERKKKELLESSFLSRLGRRYDTIFASLLKKLCLH